VLFDIFQDGDYGIDPLVGSVVVDAQVIVRGEVVPFKKVHDGFKGLGMGVGYQSGKGAKAHSDLLFDTNGRKPIFTM